MSVSSIVSPTKREAQEVGVKEVMALGALEVIDRVVGAVMV